MDVKIKLSQRELLVLSPEVQKQVKELTTTKCTAVATAGMLEEVESEEEDAMILLQDKEGEWGVLHRLEVVAEECVPLRCLEALVKDKVTFSCILDQGCQIIAVS